MNIKDIPKKDFESIVHKAAQASNKEQRDFMNNTPNEEKEELKTVAEITPTKDGIHIRGRKDIVDRIQKNFERDAIHESWEQAPPSRQEGDEAYNLAHELLGDIEYGDSRDNPKWKEKVVKAATNRIQALLLSHDKRLVEGIKWLKKKLPKQTGDWRRDDYEFHFKEEIGYNAALSAVKALIENNK